MKLINQCNTHGNKQDPEHDGQDDPYHQYPTNVFLLHLQGSEDEDKHENVIDGERHFHEIRGQIIQCGMRVVFGP